MPISILSQMSCFRAKKQPRLIRALLVHIAISSQKFVSPVKIFQATASGHFIRSKIFVGVAMRAFLIVWRALRAGYARFVKNQKEELYITIIKIRNHATNQIVQSMSTIIRAARHASLV